MKLDKKKEQINTTPRISVINTTKSSTSASEVNISVQIDIPIRIIPNIIKNIALLILVGNYENILNTKNYLSRAAYTIHQIDKLWCAAYFPIRLSRKLLLR
jgi:hypothetical protein